MSAVADSGSHIFLPQPQAGSGLRIATQQGWAPGKAPAITIPLIIPPGSGATLSERDRRLAARHEDRRRRNSAGPQEGPAEKGFQEREQERQAFERGTAPTNSENVSRSQSLTDQGGLRKPIRSALRAAIPEAVGASRAVGRSLASALEEKVVAKNAREAKYEEKRRLYLAAKRASGSDEPRVHFHGDIPFSGGERDVSTQHQRYEQRSQPNAVPPPVVKESTAGVHAPDSTHRQSSVQRQVPEQREFNLQKSSTRVVTHQPNADYAKQLRGQMGTEINVERLPLTTSTIPPTQGQSVRHAHEVATEDAGAAAASVVDRKAEYALQLQEQMAADKAMKSAIEAERRRGVVHTSSGIMPAGGEQQEHPRGDGSERVGGPVRNSKTEYAQQLRDQMAAKEHAQQAAKGLGGDSNSSSTGPSWIKGATEGRELRRKRSNAEYADQLRAQIAAQKSNRQIEQSRIAPWAQPPRENFTQAGHMEERQQQQWPGDTGYVEEHRRGPGKQSRGGEQRSSEEEPSNRTLQGERRVTSFQEENHNALALERQKRVNHQREYAEALRRDMATPKLDSLGRPIEDITSPSRTRLKNVDQYTDNARGNEVYGRGSGNSVYQETRYLQPGPRRQPGGDTRGWSNHQQNPQLQEKERLREQPPTNRAWPASHDDGRGLYGGVEHRHSQHPPVPDTRFAVYGGHPTEHHPGGGYNEMRHPLEGRRGAEWSGGGDGSSSGGMPGLPHPRRTHTSNHRDGGWDDGRGHEEERREGRRFGGPAPEEGGSAARQQHRAPAENSSGGAVSRAWREGEGGEYSSSSSRNHFHQQAYAYSGPGPPSGGVPGAGAGVGVGVGAVSTKASTMHNPVDPEELAMIQAKKDSYRRDLEAQMAEHKKLVDQRKRGAPGSKEAEVFHLQEAMEEKNERNKLAPGYELGPLGVAVMKANYSTTGRGQRSPRKVRAASPDRDRSNGSGRPAPSNNDEIASEQVRGSTSLLAPSEGSAGAGGVEGVGVPSKRGSGLRELLGTEATVERDRERSRVQAEALKKQVEDNKTRRDIEKAQLELDERKEELRLQKEREQLHKRYEEEGKLAKALESEKLMKEAGEARLALAARKEKAAAESREKEKQEDARVEREQKELETKYARERAAEEPLGQASAGPAKPMIPELPVKKHSPKPNKTPREIEAPPLIETQPNTAVEQPAAAAPTCTLPESPGERDSSRPQPASRRDLPTKREMVSIEKLRAELWKQKQLTEVLRHEVGQQETEKRKLLDMARCAKESEAAALKAVYERRASRHVLARELDETRSAAAGNELWRVPPPPMMEATEREGDTSSPKALRRAESANPTTRPSDGEHGVDRRLETQGTAEDRLLLAGLRSLSDRNRAPRGGSGLASPRKDDLGGDSTFRENVPGVRAWSSGVASKSGGGVDNNNLLAHDDPLSNGGIRAETRYVFPDGSVRRHVETPVASGRAASRSGGVPMPLVGSSRVASADLSLALGIDALCGGGASTTGGIDVGGNGDVGEPDERNRCPGKSGDHGSNGNGGAYRSPDTATGAGLAPKERPPRAHVPFLNLPASSGSARGSNGKWSRPNDRRGRGGSVSDGSVLSLLPPVYSSAKKDRNAHRGRPLAGMGGVPISPGRAMLTGPGRPGTGASCSFRTVFGEADSENGRHRRPRRRLRGGGGGKTPMADEELSDGGDSVGSGSTDVEFLRRRAEAKLRSLDQQEAADLATEEELDLRVSSSEQRSGEVTGVAAARGPTRLSQPGDGRSAAPPTNKHARRTFSTASSSNRSFMFSGRNKRPGTNQSESSMLGDSRWAVLQAN